MESACRQRQCRYKLDGPWSAPSPGLGRSAHPRPLGSTLARRVTVAPVRCAQLHASCLKLNDTDKLGARKVRAACSMSFASTTGYEASTRSSSRATLCPKPWGSPGAGLIRSLNYGKHFGGLLSRFAGASISKPGARHDCRRLMDQAVQLLAYHPKAAFRAFNSAPDCVARSGCSTRGKYVGCCKMKPFPAPSWRYAIYLPSTMSKSGQKSGGESLAQR